MTNQIDPRQRRRLVNGVKGSLREVRSQLAQFNRRVGAKLDLKDIDIDCLDLIAAHGPITPSALARRAALHPATMTGILDRLERAGWIARERTSDDRRAVMLRALPERMGEMYGALSGMNTAMDELCADYSTDQLALVADFLDRVAAAGREATVSLSDDSRPVG